MPGTWGGRVMRQFRPSVLFACALLALLAPPARATSLVRTHTASGVDWVSAGVGGIPDDTAHITVTGVTGTVTQAFLYWDGMNNVDSGVAVYDNPNITIDGNAVTGTALGDTSTNCWGQGSTRAFIADVTPFVGGNGTYALAGLHSSPSYSMNGASLVVLFDDGDASNNHDLIFYEGNDSTSIAQTFTFEDYGWHAFLNGITYNGGNVSMQFHVADGQTVNNGDDGTATLHGPHGDLTIDDTPSLGLWDGQSVPLEGTSRSPGDALWDIETFDVSSVFPAQGTYDIYIDSDPLPADCIALVAIIVDLPSAQGPPRPICGDGVVVAPEQCDDGNRIDGDCCDANCRFEPAGTVCGDATDPCLEARCDGAGGCDAEGLTCRVPVAPGAGQLVLRHGRQDRITWKWTTGVSTTADFGNPLQATDYDFCVYDKGTGSLRLLMSEGVFAGESWHATPSSFEFHDAGGALQELRLQGGLPGRAKIVARSVGGALALPPLPLAPPVLVRLRAQGGLCWAANFSAPERNTRRRFSSRGDNFYPHPTGGR